MGSFSEMEVKSKKAIEKKDEVKVVAEENDKKKIVDEFNAWYSKTKSDIENMLDGYFPNRWELVHNRDPRISTALMGLNATTRKKLIDTQFKGMYHLDGLDNRRFDLCYTAYIHFPEITVTNSKKGSHLIKDLFVKLEFGPYWNMYGMRGFRTTKSYSEYKFSYNHSHLHTGMDLGDESGWCLGHTDYNMLYNDLSTEYTESNMEMWLQQLGDYVAWESLEGGPYRKINEMKDNISYYTDIVLNMSIPSSEYEIHYKKFIENYDVFPANLITGTFAHTFSVPNSKVLSELMENISDPKYMPYKNAQGLEYFSMGKTINPAVKAEYLNAKRSIDGRSIFRFKGQQIIAKLYDDVFDKEETQKNEEEKIKDPKVVNSQIYSRIRKVLQFRLNNYYNGLKSESNSSNNSSNSSQTKRVYFSL